MNPFLSLSNQDKSHSSHKAEKYAIAYAKMAYLKGTHAAIATGLLALAIIVPMATLLSSPGLNTLGNGLLVGYEGLILVGLSLTAIHYCKRYRELYRTSSPERLVEALDELSRAGYSDKGSALCNHMRLVLSHFTEQDWKTLLKASTYKFDEQQKEKWLEFLEAVGGKTKAELGTLLNNVEDSRVYHYSLNTYEKKKESAPKLYNYIMGTLLVVTLIAGGTYFAQIHGTGFMTKSLPSIGFLNPLYIASFALIAGTVFLAARTYEKQMQKTYSWCSVDALFKAMIDNPPQANEVFRSNLTKEEWITLVKLIDQSNVANKKAFIEYFFKNQPQEIFDAIDADLDISVDLKKSIMAYQPEDIVSAFLENHQAYMQGEKAILLTGIMLVLLAVACPYLMHMAFGSSNSILQGILSVGGEVFIAAILTQLAFDYLKNRDLLLDAISQKELLKAVKVLMKKKDSIQKLIFIERIFQADARTRNAFFNYLDQHTELSLKQKEAIKNFLGNAFEIEAPNPPTVKKFLNQFETLQNQKNDLRRSIAQGVIKSVALTIIFFLGLTFLSNHLGPLSFNLGNDMNLSISLALGLVSQAYFILKSAKKANQKMEEIMVNTLEDELFLNIIHDASKLDDKTKEKWKGFKQIYGAEKIGVLRLRFAKIKNKSAPLIAKLQELEIS